MSIVTARRLADLLGQWRPAGPVSDQLAATVRTLVRDGQIPPGSRLPPERALARELAISRASVTAAYDRLRAEEYVESRRGAGSWAAVPAGHLAASDSVSRVEGIDLRIGALTAPPVLHELAREAAADLPRWLDHYGYDPLGLPPLREAIAGRLRSRGLPTEPEQVMVTAGGLHALELAVRALARRGREAVVEIPSYPAALDVLRGAGLRLRPVPTTQQGWDLEALAGIAGSGRPQLAYLIPDFHNPTGALIDAESRRRAAQILRDAGTYLVIDETFVELALDSTLAPPPMASFDGTGTVTIGSLSKAVWGGLRIGWARAEPALVQRIAGVRATVDLASPVLEQLLAVRVLEHLDEITAHRRQILRRRRASLVSALRSQLPDWRFDQPAGGLFLWVQLPGPISTTVAVAAAERGVHVSPGPRFGSAGVLESNLRLPFTLPSDQLERAVATLAAVKSSDRRSAVIDPRAAFVA